MLEDILRADFLLPNGEYSDMDAILYIMEVIAKREKEHPTGKFTNVRDAWMSFNENYLSYTKNENLYMTFIQKKIKVSSNSLNVSIDQKVFHLFYKTVASPT